MAATDLNQVRLQRTPRNYAGFSECALSFAQVTSNALTWTTVAWTRNLFPFISSDQRKHRLVSTSLSLHLRSAFLGQTVIVQTFKDYINGLALTKISVPHLTMSSLRYNPLVRHIKSPELHVGAQRISKHIAAIMSLVNVPPGHRLPKARAAGSTHAAKNGVSVDDNVIQGNWSSRRRFDNFFRLSSKTRSIFTDAVLG